MLKLWKNGAICICFSVKWQLLLQVTFQAYKSSTFPQQNHALKSSTVWILSLIVRRRTHRKTQPFPRKIPQNITKADRSSSSITIIWVFVPLRSIKYRKFDQNWSYRHKMWPCCSLSRSSHHRLPKTHANAHWPFFCRPLLIVPIRTIANKRVKAQPSGCYCGEHFKMLGRKILMTMHPTTCLLYVKGTFLTFVP